jgi:hypothetical protein
MKKILVVGDYLGGHPAHEKPAKNTIATLSDEGVTLRRGFSALAKFTWSEVTAIEAEGPEQVEKRVTATRLLAFGVFAFAAKKTAKKAYLVITTKDGEAIVETDKFDQMKLRAAIQPAQVLLEDD